MSTLAQSRSAGSFVDHVYDLMEIVDYRPAITDEERDAIFRLRYKCYLREGAIKPDFSERMSDRFDDMDNVWIFGVHVEGVLAGTLRIHVTSPDHPELPATPVFGDHLAEHIALGKTVVDPSRFVVDQDFSKVYPELAYLTTRIGWMAGEYFGADLILATARREHQAFYRRIFGHRLVCGVRPYHGLVKPLSLMVLDYPGVKDKVHRRFPFYRSSYFERRALFEAPGLPLDWSAERPDRAAARTLSPAASLRTDRQVRDATAAKKVSA